MRRAFGDPQNGACGAPHRMRAGVGLAAAEVRRGCMGMASAAELAVCGADGSDRAERAHHAKPPGQENGGRMRTQMQIRRPTRPPFWPSCRRDWPAPSGSREALTYN